MRRGMALAAQAEGVGGRPWRRMEFGKAGGSRARKSLTKATLLANTPQASESAPH